MTFMGHSDQWIKFLKHLQYVVIDEIHEYRGFFGTNVAMLLRRFFRLLQEHMIAPQVILASATCHNPAEHAKALTGRQCEVIKAQTMRPKRDFTFVAPSIDAHQFPRIYPLRIALAGLACMRSGNSTLVFTPSRKFCEDVGRIAKRKAEELGLDPEAIVAYRSGYSADQRREIEEGMRSGQFRLVFATNALEVGIDVGLLDAVILAGFPDSIMSAWQRIGRAGRSFSASANVIYYAMNNPFDLFMAENLDLFLDKPMDDLVVNLSNEELAKRHVPCLLWEKGGTLGPPDREILGETLYNLAKLEEPTYRKLGVRAAAPHNRLPIRAAFAGSYKLLADGREIGSISEEQRIKEAYIGAIYVHMGKQYRVKSHGAGEIDLVPAEPNRRTIPKTWTIATEVALRDGRRFNDHLSMYYGDLTIFNNFGGYREEDELSGDVIHEVNVDPVAHQRQVQGCWLTIEDSGNFGVSTDGLHLVEMMMRLAVAFVVPCDRYDVGSLTWTGKCAIVLHETVPGGIGIAKKIFEESDRVLEQGIRIAEGCECDAGCPKCILLQRVASDQRVSKAIAIRLAKRMHEAISRPPLEKLDPDFGSWRPV